MTTIPITPGQRISKSLAVQRRHIPVLGTLLLLIVMFSIGAARYGENFLTAQTILTVLREQSHLIVIGVGMTFVILTGGIDLSVAAVMALSTVVCAWLMGSYGWSPFAVIVVVLVGGALLGTVMGAIIQHFQIQAFIVTLAGMFFARGTAQMISEQSIPIRDPFFTETATTRINLGSVNTRPNVIIALLVLALAFYVLHYRRLGRNVYAIGGNEQSAMLMGLPVARTKILVYTISGTCAALGGVLFSFNLSSGHNGHGVGLELDAIAAVVIGGTLLTGGSGFVLG
ncbi:MAG TPA: sugar ABC transporter permease YjfF, partial [Catenuloplanes sp.]